MTSAAETKDLRRFLGDRTSEVEIETRKDGDVTYLRASQSFDEGGGRQLLLRETGSTLELVRVDDVVNWPDHELAGAPAYIGTMTDEEHAEVAAEAIAKLHYPTGDGPGQGSVACLWIARRIVQWATGKWITQSDGTRDFHDQLVAGGMVPADSDTLPAGAIIISPTSDTAVGHIGLLGAGTGGARLVYSNHSPSKTNPVAEWEQNYTVAKFTAYHQSKGLPTYCYRLPNPAAANLLAQDISQVDFSAYRGGGHFADWLQAACAAAGVQPNAAWSDGMKTLCTRESSLRPNAVNDSDSNATGPKVADGYPRNCSRGIAQCIPSTFASHHAVGTSWEIYDPVANIAAAIGYIIARYHVAIDGSDLASKVQQADPNRPPHGYLI